MDETPHSDSGSAAPREEISRRLAHQLNNLLGGILGGADFLSRRSGSDPEVRHWASLIADAAGRASELLAPAPAISARPPEAAPPAAPGRVLLIEDDPSFAQVLSAMLGELGYEPECAATGADGLSRYIRAAGTIRLVVLDALLPDESGLRTLAALREADAGVRILLCTGLDDAALAGKDLGGCPVIKKPFRMADLARAVALALRPAPVAPPPPPLAEAARRALVVEDEPVMRNLLVRTLAETSWEVTAVCAGAEARPRFSDPFDLVLLDWNLPDASGLDLCREARAGEAGSIRHILMITAMSAAEDRERALGAGADDYLGKPFPLDLLRVRLAVAEKAIGDPGAG